MKANIVKLAAVSLLAVCSVAKADIVELALDCAGVYDANSSPWSTDFDLGVSFSEISHVYIDWSGDITGGLAVQGGSDPFAIDVGIIAYLENPPNWRHTDVWGGEATYPGAESFALLSEFQDGIMPWSELFDGQARITIDYTEEIILDGRYVEHGSIVLDSATLVVDGTIVPEPGTFLLLGLGAIFLRQSQRSNRQGYVGEIHRVRQVRPLVVITRR
ncbi:MAG: PEP-CTERM sorting domain-containing protein [Planctomycetota bacterium]|jgi:hypothetical protein